MMSSDGSITSSSASRIRQFGLYRTIDARTEEFLRQSRKRQIRQGCACAAVSTAITVTIVVSVLLVYEYNISSEVIRNKNYIIKPHWLGFINESADATPYDVKIPKSKLNIDKTTLKLLPILLKALNKNRFLENIIEDHSSPTSLERRDTTEYSIQKNDFSDTKTWHHTQSPRLYAIEYKSSPVLFYRSPTRNIDYFTKVRKIREYRRMLNYFDKMISEKVGYGVTSPMMKTRLTRTDKPAIQSTTVPIKKNDNLIKNKHSMKNPKKNGNKIAKEDNCKCPRKLGNLLGKLISNINQIIPYMSKMPLSPLCKSRQTSKLSTLSNSSTHIPTIKARTIMPMETITTHTSETPMKFADKSAIMHDSFPNNKLKDYLGNRVLEFPLLSHVLKMNVDKFDSNSDPMVVLNKLTTASQKNVIETTESKITDQTATKPIQIIKDRLIALSTNDYFSEKSIMDTSTENHNRKSFFSNEEYEAYFASTPYGRYDFDMLDIPNLELIKRKMISANKPESIIRKLNNAKTSNKSKSKPKSPIYSSLLAHKKMDAPPETKTNYSKLFSMPKYKQSTKRPQHYEMTSQIKSISQMATTESNEINQINQNDSEIYKLEQIHNSDNTTFDEDPDKVLPEEQFQEDEEIRQVDNSQRTINKNRTQKIRQSSNVDSIKSYNTWKITKIPEIIIPKLSMSMIPDNRPLFLEILRNDFRQDENQDFDMNLNNNIFDLPPI